MNARVESDHFPYLPLRLDVRGQTYTVEALIDTGFDGHVVLSPASLTHDEPADDYHTWQLADGSQVVRPFYLGTVRIGDLGPFPAAITLLGDEPIVGRGITDQLLLHLDHGRRVIAES